MLVRDIASRFCEELGLREELTFLGKVSVCVAISEWSSGRYRQYLDWEATQSYCSSGSNVYVRVFDSVGVGRLAECVGVYGVGSLDEMFSRICIEWGIANPCGETGLLGFAKGWLEKNEADWLGLAEGFVSTEE